MILLILHICTIIMQLNCVVCKVYVVVFPCLFNNAMLRFYFAFIAVLLRNFKFLINSVIPHCNRTKTNVNFPLKLFFCFSSCFYSS